MLDNNNIQYGQYVVPIAEDCVHFGVGQPRNEMLPLKEVNEALINIASLTNPALLQYGKIEGYDKFRKSLAKFIGEETLSTINPNNLLVTNGITGGISLFLSVYAKAGMTIFCEDPSYFLALNIMRDLHMNIIPIKTDHHGINVNELVEYLEKMPEDQPVFLYLIPFFQNPTGFSLSRSRLEELLAVATKYNNLKVLSDEVYQLLSFDGSVSMMPLAIYHKNFVSFGSFSKISAPGLRMGWMFADNHIINKIAGCGQLDSSGCVNPIGCAIVHELLLNGKMKSIINRWREFLKSNCDRLYSIIDELSEFVEHVNKPSGGYFLWLKLKDHISGIKLSEVMEKYKVKFHYGNKFSESKSCDNYIRLSYSWYTGDDYNLGVKRLKNMFEKEYNKCIKVMVLGETGRLGKLIVKYLTMDSQFEYLGGISRFDLTNDHHVINENIINCDVIIDVSSPEGTQNLIKMLTSHYPSKALIIGTTGKLPVELIDEYSKDAAVVMCPNFSLGILQLKDIIEVINKDEWSASMIERHHKYKKDAPSGTAKLLATTYGIEYLPIDTIKSVREGEIIGEHEIVLKRENETIRIIHTVDNRDLFARDSLFWINWILGKKNGLYHI